MARPLYGINISEASLERANKEDLARQDARNPLLKHKAYSISDIEKRHPFKSKNVEFLIITSLLAFIGLFRLRNQSYFRNMLRAFRNAGLSSRQLREQLQQNSMAELTMDLFFCCSIAVYLYQVLLYFNQDAWLKDFSKLGLIGTIAVALMIVYFCRSLFLKIAGWLFLIPEMMEQYSFQIFLINKILGISLLPFIIILAFGQGGWVQASLFLSFVWIGLLFIYRYIRSGSVFQYFLKFSKFHFFMYLCASEVLPLAVLIKLISTWLPV
jgi:hypothetical protein